MILARLGKVATYVGKPRASGDDPPTTHPAEEATV